MLTNDYEYDDIKRLTFQIMYNPILSPLAKTAYLIIARIVSFLFKVSVFYQMCRFKSQKEKTRLKMNVLISTFIQNLVENRTFSNYLPFN